MRTNLNLPAESTKRNTQWVARFLLLIMLFNTFQGSLYARGTETQILSIENGKVAKNALQITGLKVFKNAESDELDKESVLNKTTSVLSTGGPGQSESSGFSLSSTDGMVDKFSGDFTYSIPLADIEGYPLVLSYNSAVSMNSDASWVGLGWDLNVGAVSRELRGLPDEFNGKQTVDRTYNQAPATNTGWKFGAYAGVNPMTGGPKDETYRLALNAQITALLGRYTDSYVGVGRTFDFGVQASPSLTFSEKYSFGPTFGFGYTSDTKRGIGRSFNMGLSAGGYSSDGDNASAEYKVSNNYNSRQGMTTKTKSFSAEGGWQSNKLGVGGSYGASSTVMYGTQTSVPTIPISNFGTATSGSMNIYVGKKYALAQTTVMLGIINTQQDMGVNPVLNENHQIKQPAVGYFHNGKYYNYPVSDTQFPIMDFNRTGMEEYSEHMKNLAFSVQTYDIFRVNALGMGATFRARRNDFGTVQDPQKENKISVSGTNMSAGLVNGTAENTITLGISETFGNSTTTTDIVEEESGGQALSFTHEAVGDAFDKAVYFKGVGEMTPENIADENLLGGNEPSYFQLRKSTDEKDIVLKDVLYTNGSTTTITSSTLNQPEEVVRATSYKPYTAKEYTEIGTNAKYNYYQSYALNAPVYGSKTDINRLQTSTANNANYSNHLSVIEIVNTAGMKYFFGIPAYDLNSAQVSFCASGMDSGNSLAEYDPKDIVSGYDGDNSIENVRGTSKYFDKTVMPAVAHSFLLTEVQSPDYIDRTLDGPSIDDIGNYYKFNYTRLYSSSSPYKWRLPVEEEQAFFSVGKLATAEDDMAHYSYGEKEIWYTNSVESKNLVAEFILEDRFDGRGVTDEDGGLNVNSKLKLLKKIVIYNRSERMNPTTGSSAVPLQTIEFEYTHELCRKHPTNIYANDAGNYDKSGKLTLKSIRSYSGASEEMGQYAYTFDYGAGGTDNVDFSYEPDAWGGYKEVDSNKPLRLFPYADQDATDADEYAKSWKLKQIILPSGGTIRVEYEADSYATIQNKRVMNHVDVEGFTNIYELLGIRGGSSWNGTTGKYNDFHKDLSGSMSGTNETLAKKYYSNFGKLNEGRTPNNVIIFKMDKTIPVSGTPDPDQVVKDNYFTSLDNQVMSELFLKMYVKIKPLDALRELIPMFGTIKDNLNEVEAIGVLPPLTGNTYYSYGYVVLNPSLVDENDNKQMGTVINSLQKSAIEYVRRELPDILYGTCPTCESNMFLDKAVRRNGDVNLIMQQDGWVELIATDKKLSTLRLYDADNLKYGGNGRVRTITYNDNWATMSTENTGEYIWNYKYPDRFSTSGNAAAEPGSILDECDLYQWDSYMNHHEKYPDETMKTEKPIAGILLPAPVIGYEEVVVDIEGVENKGYSKTTYYTTHQFPMITKATVINKGVSIDEPTNTLLGLTTQKFGFSQGYVVETNDFHGKIKENAVYNKVFDGVVVNDVLQARSTYVYADLEDQHKALKRNADFVDVSLAQETDIHIDTRYIETRSVHTQIGVSLKLKFPPPVPYLLPSFMRVENTQSFYSSAMVKHINRSAILKEVITEELGSINSAKNIVYDYQTGNVLLSSLRDEYNDELFSFSYPAHWYYKGFREYAESQSKEMAVNIMSNNTFTAPLSPFLTEGDYIQLLDVSGQPKAWVALNVVNNTYYLMGAAGNKTILSITTGTNNIKILQSNRENRQDEMMQTVVTKHNPISGSTFTFPVAEILSSSAITYKHRKSINCGTPMSKESGLNNNEIEIDEEFNPYLLGVRGDLVPDMQYSWQSERLNATHAYKTRFDGTYTDYAPFYQSAIAYMGQDWFQICENDHPDNVTVGDYLKWRKSGVVNFYDAYGTPLESKDEITVKSAMLLGYNKAFSLLPSAQAIAARQQDIGFDGFEDYSYYNYLIDDSSGGTLGTGITTSNDRFSYKIAVVGNANVSVDNTIRHSGLSSLKIINNSAVAYTAVVDQVNHEDLVPEDEEGYGYMAESCYCIPDFAPNAGKFVVSGWIKVSDPNSSPGKIVVNIAGGTPATYNYTPTGNIIDGWRRVEGTFTIPTNATGITIKLEQTSGSAAYFDDIRIHPFNAGMSTTVYDPKTLLPLAKHDAFNYTIFYNYDSNNQLVRMRVETVDGIKTVSESEMSGFKQPKP